MKVLSIALALAGLTSMASAAAFELPTFSFPTRPTTTTSTKTTPTPTPAVTCLTNSTATYLINGFASLLTAYNNATANAILASTFTDTSDSINFLVGLPLGATTFPSKAAFESGQGAQPSIGFTILGSPVVACTSVAFRWTATLGAYPAQGINVFTATNLNGTSAGWQIDQNFSEFNVGAWELDIGNSCGPYTPANGPAVS